MGRKKLTIPNLITHAASGPSRIVWIGKPEFFGEIGSTAAAEAHQGFTARAFYRAFPRACENAALPWGTHQNRHVRGTIDCEKFGTERAQVGLDHSHARLTEIYEEKNELLSKEIAEKVG